MTKESANVRSRKFLAVFGTSSYYVKRGGGACSERYALAETLYMALLSRNVDGLLLQVSLVW